MAENTDPINPVNPAQITIMLGNLAAGQREVADELLPLIYNELRARARGILKSGQLNGKIQATEVVHEAYLRLVDQSGVDWRGRQHFYAVAAMAMRQIIIDQVRHYGRAKRGGGLQLVTLDDSVAPLTDPDVEVFALYEALEKLEQLDPRQAKIVELRFFGGLTVEEVADILGLSVRTVGGEWNHAKAWLRLELSRSGVE